MNPTEIEINGKQYQLRKLPPLVQFHVMRRLAPVLMALGESASDQLLTELKSMDLLKALKPVSDMIATMPDSEVEYVINTCLEVVDRKADQGVGWSKIQAQPGVMMYADIDITMMLKLTAAVVQDNLGNFLDALPIN